MPPKNMIPARKQLAAEFLNERAVTLDPVLRYNKGKAFPHFVPFIPYPYQLGVPDASSIYQVTAAQAEGPDGLTIAANGGLLDIPVRLDRDMDYHLLSIKYAAHILPLDDPERTVDEGSRGFLVPPASFLSVAGSPFTAQANQYIPYVTYLEAAVYLVGAGARDQYGGLQNNSTTRAKEEFLQPIHGIQKSEDGPGQIRLAAQLPASTIVMIRMKNNFTLDLRVNGTLFGYKV